MTSRTPASPGRLRLTLARGRQGGRPVDAHAVLLCPVAAQFVLILVVGPRTQLRALTDEREEQDSNYEGGAFGIIAGSVADDKARFFAIT